jgi:hypothetical protein
VIIGCRAKVPIYFNLFGETAQGMVGMQLVEGYKPSMFPISIFLPHSVPKGKASLNLKKTLWGDKPECLLPENCPNFLFFCLGRVILIMTRFLKEERPDKVGLF